MLRVILAVSAGVRWCCGQNLPNARKYLYVDGDLYHLENKK